MILTTYEISEAFEFGTYARGKKYFLEGKVISYTVLTEGTYSIHISSNVAGSYKNKYTQDILITQTRTDHKLFQASCSCPVTINCKHVVAVCFQYQYDETHKDKAKKAMTGFPCHLILNLAKNPIHWRL